ncbi:MAG TPA: TIGR03557 family F420-dependent LLM class oxidoreductase [Terriglobales bacterium]|nr:TIGR03557 family F420-dependent LLM class oxidoreductase [Terriglobales bacterium]
MVEMGYMLSTEEFRAKDLIRFATRAEAAGFSFATISDHFHPWTDSQGNSPFVWTVIGGIGASADRLQLGTTVTCPTMRVHPAVIAQAAATTADMMPGRFFLGVGTGENLNEHIVGQGWPPHSVRLKMLREAVAVIRELWKGDYYSHEGEYFLVENARLYTLPKEPPPIYMAASGTDAAAMAGEIADGLITTSADKRLVEIFDHGSGRKKPKYVQINVCYAADERTARETAFEHWPISGLPGSLHSALATPSEFMDAAKLVTEETVAKAVVCGPDPERHREKIRESVSAGFDHVFIHQIGPEQEECIDFYRREILPDLHSLAA